MNFEKLRGVLSTLFGLGAGEDREKTARSKLATWANDSSIPVRTVATDDELRMMVDWESQVNRATPQYKYDPDTVNRLRQEAKNNAEKLRNLNPGDRLRRIVRSSDESG